jgi:unsaturated chondroitin disaccharide hydrolase
MPGRRCERATTYGPRPPEAGADWSTLAGIGAHYAQAPGRYRRRMDDPPELAEALAHASNRVAGLRAGPNGLPHVTGADGHWQLLSPLASEDAALTGLPWTGGFVAGQLWLAGRQHEAARVTELLAPRAAQPTTHDLGFLFWPSAVLGYIVTGGPHYRELGLRAARSLVERALPSGVIQVIGELDDPAWRGRSIVDTWPNLGLLWWAEREGAADAGAAARAHLAATLDTFLRPDGSTFHAARFADDGSVLELGTLNGHASNSTWARGHAWAVHGLATAARATGNPDYAEAAAHAARWFLDHLGPDLIPPWDFDAPAGDPRDASAGAIVASALFDLGWEDDALRLLEALAATCLNRGPGDGLLLHCCYRHPFRLGLDCATAWGDFFLLDALHHSLEPQARPDPLT